MLQFPRKRVGIVPIYDSEMTHGLYGKPIYIPESAKERVDQGIVKYIGPDVTTLKPGDYVIFSGYSGTLVMFENEKLIVMPEEFVLAKWLYGESLVVPGLFIQVRGYEKTFPFNDTIEYIPVTYEVAVPLLAQAFEDHKQTLDIKPSEPSNSDIERMRG